ncbi:hypothetical protein LZ187_14945, partial [Rhodovulum sulfidophilum]|nr:hypothetical protein [Rhodovulum sulfidophilum]
MAARALAAQPRHDGHPGIGPPDFHKPLPIVRSVIPAHRLPAPDAIPTRDLTAPRQPEASDPQHRLGIDPETMVRLPRGKPGPFFAMPLFDQPGHQSLSPDPGFAPHQHASHHPGAIPVTFPLQKERGGALETGAEQEPLTDPYQADHSEHPGPPDWRSSIAILKPYYHQMHFGPFSCCGIVGRDPFPQVAGQPRTCRPATISRYSRPADPVRWTAKALCRNRGNDRLADRPCGPDIRADGTVRPQGPLLRERHRPARGLPGLHGTKPPGDAFRILPDSKASGMGSAEAETNRRDAHR